MDKKYAQIYDYVVAQVRCTNDYDKFTFLSNNREPDHVNQIIASLRNRAVPSAILCNEKFQIIDGQNTFLARKELGLPIYYYCMDGLGIYDVASLNSFGKNWSYIDFIKMWAGLGHEQYQTMLDFHNTYSDLSLAVVVMILGGVAKQRQGMGSDKYIKDHGKARKPIDRIKTGDFIIKDMNKAHHTARCILQYKRFANGSLNIYKQQNFAAAIIQLLDNPKFNNDECVRKISLWPTKFYRCITVKEYVEMLIEVFNFKNRNKIRF